MTRDGYLDIFLVNGGKTPGFKGTESTDHALYRNNRNGTFINVTQRAGILPNRAYGMGVAAGDYNNDGYVDLFVTHFEGQNLLYRNNGNGTFAEVSAQAGVAGKGEWSSSSAFLDYDRDGDLDLFVCHYTNHSFRRNYICPIGNPPQKAYCSPKVYGGVPNSLYRNNGDGTFADASEPAGVALSEGKSLGVVAGDFDGDGWIDLYVANDQVRNFLFQNNRDGTFREVGMEKAVALDENGNAQAGMGVDMGDFDNDGRFDLAVSNLDTEYLALYRNLGKRGFEDVSRRWGVASATTPHVGFGTRFIDFDNDGWLDLLVANGHILDNIELLRPQAHFAQPKVLLRNTGTRFEEVTALHGKALSSNRVSRGVAFGDFDNDGDIDALVNNTSDHPQLLRNDRGNRNAWLALDLKGLSNGPATGAVVEVRVAGRMRIFQSLGGASYMAANDPRIHIGLGAAEVVDELVVRWPHGGVDRMKKPQLRRFMLVDETKGFSVKMGSSNWGRMI